MNKNFLAVFLLTLITASSAALAQSNSKYYVGLDVAVAGPASQSTISNVTEVYTVNTPMKLTLGRQSDPGFALEVSFINISSKKVWVPGGTFFGRSNQTLTASLTQSASFIPVEGVWSRDFTPVISASLKAGLGLLNGEYDFSGRTQDDKRFSETQSVKALKATFGASASYRFTPAISAVVGFDYIPAVEFTAAKEKHTLTNSNAYLGARFSF